MTWKAGKDRPRSFYALFSWKFKLSAAIINLTSPQVSWSWEGSLAGGYAILSRRQWQPCDTSIVWHDRWWKTAPCWLSTTMSSGCFSRCLLLMPLKFKITKTKSEVSNERLMSIRSVCAYFLINNCVQDLPENELANMSATRECTSVEDRVMVPQ